MLAKLSLNEAVQVGPWRIARKHLLFVILFSISIIAFGIIILMTHVFDNKEESEGEENEGEENENEHENEENDDEDHKFWGSQQQFSSGDWIVVAIMITAGLMAVGATMVCFMVKKDAPRRLNSSRGNTSVYSVQFNNGESKAPIPDQTTYSPPQPLPLWSGQVQLPSTTNNAAPAAASQSQHSRNDPIQITVSNLPRKSKQKNMTESPSAPQIEGECPPPYSP